MQIAEIVEISNGSVTKYEWRGEDYWPIWISGELLEDRAGKSCRQADLYPYEFSLMGFRLVPLLCDFDYNRVLLRRPDVPWSRLYFEDLRWSAFLGRFQFPWKFGLRRNEVERIPNGLTYSDCGQHKHWCLRAGPFSARWRWLGMNPHLHFDLLSPNVALLSIRN